MQNTKRIRLVFLVVLLAAAAGLVAVVLRGGLALVSLTALLAFCLLAYVVLGLFLYTFVYPKALGQALVRAAFVVLGIIALSSLLVLLR